MTLDSSLSAAMITAGWEHRLPHTNCHGKETIRNSDYKAKEEERTDKRSHPTQHKRKGKKPYINRVKKIIKKKKG
jgi:hypothetical protein